nr:MAG TPA: 40S ribosomal protein SA [Caudoviricetes sp.]
MTKTFCNKCGLQYSSYCSPNTTNTKRDCVKCWETPTDTDYIC